MSSRTLFLSMLAPLFALALSGAATAPATAPASRPATAPAATSATSPTSKPTTLAAAKSTLDGVANAEQIARGKKTYDIYCSRCHGETLLGNDDAAALVGEDFLQRWANGSVGKLVEYTRKQMPADNPGTLSRKDCTDIVTYLLSANSMAAGKTEWSAELDDLNAILIQVKK